MEKKIYAVVYTYDPQKSEELTRERPGHRAFLRSLFEKGELLASGPLGDGQALIIVKATTPTKALTLLDPDPLHAQEIIKDREVKEWNPNIGPFAS